MKETTIGIVKPDFVPYIHEIASIIITHGLKIPKIYLLAYTDQNVIDQQYYYTNEELRKYGNNNLNICDEKGLDPSIYFGQGYKPLETGKIVIERHKAYMMSGGIAAIIVQGDNAKTRLKELAGKTEPIKAVPGTIRYELAGTYGDDHPLIVNSLYKAILTQTTIHNVIHVPDPENADKDLNLWRNKNHKGLITVDPFEKIYSNLNRSSI